ncbi:MAG: outer membrane protein assembly factor BamD [Candidatus Rokubacteria bacterium]|nr:outer membrane protein assembly factor BamD [Candidatus Rokubacteria bacterium]
MTPKGGSAPLQYFPGVIVALALVVGGCAGVAEVTGTATQTDMMQLRADVTQLQLGLQRLRAGSEKQSAGVETRLSESAAQSQRQADDVARRLEALTTTLTTLSARMDELATRVDGLARRATTAPSPSRPPVSAPPPAAPPAPAGPVAGTRPSTGALQPQDVYQAAYIDFSKGSYPLAIAGFREFLRRYPEHELADNAQYWIGEAHFSVARAHANAGQPDKATQELERAVQEFRKVIANYPRGDKAPTALYKEALALVELKEPTLAQARLQYLIENFPQAEETPLARERLAALKGS